MHRPAYLAGMWYPADERDCRAAIESHARDVSPEPGPRTGLIGPHAGWTYSGDAAGHAYRWLAESAEEPDLVVVFGSHRGPQGPNTVFRGQGWDTPLGPLTTARPLADQIVGDLDLDDEPVRPQRPDNAVELHLPFVRAFFPRAELLMVGVAASDASLEIGRRVGQLVKASKRNALFVGSTDLTHYGPNYGFSPAGGGADAVQWVRQDNDRGFLDAVVGSSPIRALDHAAQHQSACCPGAVAATMTAIEAYAGTYDPKLIDHYLSYDVRPDSSFVGYASLVL